MRRARRAHVEQLDDAGRERAAAAAAARLLAGLPVRATIALYHASGMEQDAGLLCDRLHAVGHALALPRLTGGSAMTFAAWSPGAPLEAGPHDVLQPPGDATPVEPEIIVAPLLAFDRRGGRLGQGGGHYDRAFAALPRARRIGLAWSVQEVPVVPCDPWDVPLHAVATEAAWILCGDAA
jgi:5-formyltetrahydrofolate cyclo-ligase